MSLNLFVSLVGPSGSGKGACDAAARDAVAVTYDQQRRRPVDVPEFPLGSGEGIARTYRPAGLEDDKPNELDRALFTAPEIDTVAALFDRSGATLEGELRKVYSGEPIGFNNAHKLTRSVVAAHSYRACLVVGVQPLRARALLDGADGGTPQRLLWLPVTDPDAPDVIPVQPPPRSVLLPDWPAGPLVIPDVARATIDAARLARLRGETDDAAALDAHALLSRLKTAAALAVLDGRTAIDAADWKLAGVVMSVSDATRAGVQRAMSEQERRTATARALAAARRDEIIAERKFARASDRILAWLDRGPMPRTEIRRKLKEDIRPNFDAAAAELAATGRIYEYDTEGRATLALVEQGLESPGTHTEKPSPNSADTLSPTGT